MTFSHLKTESRSPWVFVNLGREVGDLAAPGSLHVCAGVPFPLQCTLPSLSSSIPFQGLQPAWLSQGARSVPPLTLSLRGVCPVWPSSTCPVGVHPCSRLYSAQTRVCGDPSVIVGWPQNTLCYLVCHRAPWVSHCRQSILAELLGHNPAWRREELLLHEAVAQRDQWHPGPAPTAMKRTIYTLSPNADDAGRPPFLCAEKRPPDAIVSGSFRYKGLRGPLFGSTPAWVCGVGFLALF